MVAEELQNKQSYPAKQRPSKAWHL